MNLAYIPLTVVVALAVSVAVWLVPRNFQAGRRYLRVRPFLRDTPGRKLGLWAWGLSYLFAFTGVLAPLGGVLVIGLALMCRRRMRQGTARLVEAELPVKMALQNGVALVVIGALMLGAVWLGGRLLPQG